MTNKATLEFVLNTAGLTLEKYGLMKNNSMVGYKFEAHRNGEFEFEVATDSFEDAMCQTLEGIYNTDNIVFTPFFV